MQNKTKIRAKNVLAGSYCPQWGRGAGGRAKKRAGQKLRKRETGAGFIGNVQINIKIKEEGRDNRKISTFHKCSHKKHQLDIN